MEVRISERTHPMEKDGEWFTFKDSSLGPGDDYYFVIDGLELPDPRSNHQPEGVHGPSRIVDHGDFQWSDQAWEGFDLSTSVLYELHIGTFSPQGTFDGAIEKLPHLVDLGVGAIELMPVAEFPGKRGWGYDGVDIYAPHHHYGGPDGLKRLVDASHAIGLGVVMDVVYNHLGPDGNYLSKFAPYFTDRYLTPWGKAVNFDDSYSNGVKNFFIDNALMWLRDYHFDGLRIDAVHAIFDSSATHFLEELQLRVADLESEVGRRFFLIAESDLNDPRLIWPKERGGYGLSAQWSDDFHHALHCVLTGERDGYYEDFGSVADLAASICEAYVYSGRFSNFRKRNHGRKTGIDDGGRFVVYLQNHDQVGNRAKGERISHLISNERTKIGAAIVLLSPFVPMLFHGEEWGASTPFLYFTDHEDLELGEAVRKGRREEFASFGWDPDEVPDPQDPATLERSKLDWDEPLQSPHFDLLEWYRSLIKLRGKLPDLASHDLSSTKTFHSESGWIVIERGKAVIACNFSAQSIDLEIGTESSVMLSSAPLEIAGTAVSLPPESVGVLEVKGFVSMSPDAEGFVTST